MTARIVWEGDDPLELTPEDVAALAREGIAFPAPPPPPEPGTAFTGRPATPAALQWAKYNDSAWVPECSPEEAASLLGWAEPAAPGNDAIRDAGRIYPCCDDPACTLCFGSGVFDPRLNPQVCVRCGAKGATPFGLDLLCDDCVPLILPPPPPPELP